MHSCSSSSSDSSCHTYKPFYNSLEIFWSIVLQNKGILLGNKTLYLLGECNMILLIIFFHNGERHSIKAHTLALRGKITEVCIDFFLSGVCFGHKGQFNESTCRVPQGKTIIQRQKMVFLNAIGQGWLGCTPRGVISIFRYSHSTRERLGPVSMCSESCNMRKSRRISNVQENKHVGAYSMVQVRTKSLLCTHTGQRSGLIRGITTNNCGVSRVRTDSRPWLV